MWITKNYLNTPKDKNLIKMLYCRFLFVTKLLEKLITDRKKTKYSKTNIFMEDSNFLKACCSLYKFILKSSNTKNIFYKIVYYIKTNTIIYKNRYAQEKSQNPVVQIILLYNSPLARNSNSPSTFVTFWFRSILSKTFEISVPL